MYVQDVQQDVKAYLTGFIIASSLKIQSLPSSTGAFIRYYFLQYNWTGRNSNRISYGVMCVFMCVFSSAA